MGKQVAAGLLKKENIIGKWEAEAERQVLVCQIRDLSSRSCAAYTSSETDAKGSKLSPRHVSSDVHLLMNRGL